VLWSLGYFGVSGSLKSGLIGDPRSELIDQVNRWNAEGGKESSGDDLSQRTAGRTEKAAAHNEWIRYTLILTAKQ
jgi:hypothetical protein